MGQIHAIPKAKLTIGFIAKEESLFSVAENILTRKFGPIDFKSPVLKFDHTTYYANEMGQNLLRKFISFKKLINPGNLSTIKIFTNHLEDKFLTASRNRAINLDPGYLTDAKLVLATTKNYCHRIYLNKGIFAEVTLSFKSNTFTPWPWAYPDYQTKEYLEIFNHIRNLYLENLKCTHVT